MKKLAAILGLFITAGFLSLTASADTITLVSTGGQSVNGVYIYPYNISVNGAAALAMMCLDFNRHVDIGETWTANPISVPLDSSQLSQDYRALALIFSDIQAPSFGISIADYQFAAWSIFDPAIIGTNSGYTPTAALVRAGALAYAVNPANYNYSSFTIYDPTGPIDSSTPQRFITEGSTGTPFGHPLDVVPTPEPSSLLLLGTGVIGIATMVRKRMVKI